jgi:hypothetical protein
MEVPCEEKSMSPVCKNVKTFAMVFFIDYRASQFTKLAKCKNGEGCRGSMSAPAPYLHCQLSEKIMVWFSLPLLKVHSI